MNDPLLALRKITIIIGSTIIGVCIGLPLYLVQNQQNSPYALVPLIAAAAAGTLIGWRKKESHPFFFFVLFALVTLGGIILGAYQGPTLSP